MRKKLPGYSSEIKGARKIGWRERVPKGWYVVKEGTYYKHIKPIKSITNPKKTYRTITTFPSKSKPGKVYTVKMDEVGNLSCDCPIWVFKRGGVRDCYHVRVVKSEMKNPISRIIRDKSVQLKTLGEWKEIGTMGLKKTKNPTKILWEHLKPRGYRKCNFCGDIVNTRKYRRQDICKKCYAEMKNPASLYQSFHGVPPSRKVKVYYEEPGKKPLVKIGRLVRIEYEPEPPSKLTGTRYTHEGGDLGHKVIRSNAILATNKKGTQLYIVKEKNTKYPRFSSGGILG